MSSRYPHPGFVELLSVLGAGQALYWFIAGEAATHSTLRNALVLVQAVLFTMLLAWSRRAIRRPPAPGEHGEVA